MRLAVVVGVLVSSVAPVAPVAPVAHGELQPAGGVAMVLTRVALVAALASCSAGCTELSLFECAPPLLSVAADATADDGLSVGPEGVSIHGEVPHAAAECAGCADDDGDGMSDVWELDALRRLRPLVRFDRNEPLFCDRSAALLMVGRVTPAPEPDHYRAFIAVLYTRDYGRCSVAEHLGDVERVVVDLRAVSSTDMIIEGIYTAAHEDTPFDGGRIVRGAELAGELELAQTDAGSTRWVVYASSSKHALYLNRDACAAHESLVCAREACDPPAHDAKHEVLFRILDAGEPDAPRSEDDLAQLIEADAWTTRPFCPSHGVDRTPCGPGVIRDKLRRDPFVDGQPEL